MAKSKATVGKASPAGKSAKRTAAKKTAKTSTAKKKPPAKSGQKASQPKASLGRPKVTLDEPLDMLFHHDFGARQVFTFLGVKTVRELEELRPSEIIERLTRPMVDSVERIRSFLAEKNRYLAGDEGYLRKKKAR